MYVFMCVLEQMHTNRSRHIETCCGTYIQRICHVYNACRSVEGLFPAYVQRRNYAQYAQGASECPYQGSKRSTIYP